jgi:hypothetical protein
MEQHPLSTALSSLVPISPSFIYLHHPYHSSGYALPADFNHQEEDAGPVSDEEGGSSGVDQEGETRISTVTVKVDLGALSNATDDSDPRGSASTVSAGTTVSQKTFYNAIIRTTFAVITRKIVILKARHRHADGTSITPKGGKRRSMRSATDPFDAATRSFEETFRPLVGKDVYRWDVFLTRLRLMLDAFQHIVALGLGEDDTDGESGIALVLVILESQLLQKCLGVTWHALLRLNEMVRRLLPAFTSRDLVANIVMYRLILAPLLLSCVLYMLGMTSSR